jgi:hypothetical protein
MIPLGIKAWYSDGRKFSTATSDPHTWPTEGALLFMIYYEEKTPAGMPMRRNACGGDWFVVTPDLEVIVSDYKEDGTWVDAPSLKEGEILIQGKYISDQEYIQTMKAAHGDKLWP